MKKILMLTLAVVLVVVSAFSMCACSEKITEETIDAALQAETFYGEYSDGTGGIALTFTNGKVFGQAYTAKNSGTREGSSGTLSESYTIDLEASTVTFVSSKGKESVCKYQYEDGKIVRLDVDSDSILFAVSTLTTDKMKALLETNYFSRTTSGTYNSTIFQMCFKDGKVYERIILEMGGVGSYGEEEPFTQRGTYEVIPATNTIKYTKTGGSVEYYSYYYTGDAISKVFGLSSSGSDSYPYEAKDPISTISLSEE